VAWAALVGLDLKPGRAEQLGGQYAADLFLELKHKMSQRMANDHRSVPDQERNTSSPPMAHAALPAHPPVPSSSSATPPSTPWPTTWWRF
jgi:hypothetical protein